LREELEIPLSAHAGSPKIILYDEYWHGVPLRYDNWPLVTGFNVDRVITTGSVIGPSIQLKNASKR
jgi:hypothetical protein